MPGYPITRPQAGLPLARAGGGLPLGSTPRATPTARDAAATHAARDFEALVMGEMLRAMRSAKLGDGLLDSPAATTFRERADALLAADLAIHAPLGLSAQLEGPRP